MRAVWRNVSDGGGARARSPRTRSAAIGTTKRPLWTRRWSIVLAASLACALSLVSLTGPAGAAGATPTVTVTDSAAGVQTGGSFTFTVTVAGPAGTPTGTVNWTVTGPAGPITCAASTLDASGTGTCGVNGTQAGTYSATAHYEGDVNYDTGSGSDAS